MVLSLDSADGRRLWHLRAAGVSVVLDCRGPGLPQVLHWGADLGDLAAADLDFLADATVPPVASNALDNPVPVAVLPEHATGWVGMPGLTGHRQGRDWSVLFTIDRVLHRQDERGRQVTITAGDAAARLGLTLDIALAPSGLLRMRATLRNEDTTDRAAPFTLDGLVLALPVPTEAAEILDLTGRHCRERSPQRQSFTVGARLRDNRRGRTGADATLVLVAGHAGFGFRTGEVWGVHVAWSGNHRAYAERLPSGPGVIGGGELLLPGEVTLGAGESYESPWLFGSWGHGLDELSGRFHTWLRDRPHHPGAPRPVVLNTWEAVYFDHDLDRLRALADAAAEVGAERFVLDDG